MTLASMTSVDVRSQDAAKTKARIDAFSQMAVGFLGVHLILANIYYRGFVYIVCGPRRSMQPPEPTHAQA